MGCPGTAIAGPVFVSARSARGVSTSMSMSRLLLPFGSEAPAGGMTVTLFKRMPVASGRTSAFTVNVTVPPGRMLTRVSIDNTLLAEGGSGQLDPGLATQLQAAFVMFSGNGSNTRAPVAALGPALVTTMV